MLVSLVLCRFPGFPALVDNKNGRRYPGAIEKLSGKSNNRLKDIILNESLPDNAFRPTTKQNPMENNDTHLAFTLQGNFNQMADKGVVTPAFRGDPRQKRLNRS